MPTAYPTPDADEEMDEMTDELRTLESRTRSLAARVETLTAERDTARASSDRWHGVAHRMEEERHAAVKAKEEAEARADSVEAMGNRLAEEAASLRAQVEQLTVERGDYAVKADGSYREVQRLAYQVEQMRGALERFAFAWDANCGHGIPLESQRQLREDFRAALSPSPASATRTETQWGERRSYVTDDRDEERRNVLSIAPGGNGDWYVSVHPEGEGDCGRAVRLCTSGGAANAAPGLPVAIADAYRALAPSPASGVAENVCEHGDHPAPPGQRFCSKACQRCEVTMCSEDLECAGICMPGKDGGR